MVRKNGDTPNELFKTVQLKLSGNVHPEFPMLPESNGRPMRRFFSHFFNKSEKFPFKRRLWYFITISSTLKKKIPPSLRDCSHCFHSLIHSEYPNSSISVMFRRNESLVLTGWTAKKTISLKKISNSKLRMARGEKRILQQNIFHWLRKTN